MENSPERKRANHSAYLRPVLESSWSDAVNCKAVSLLACTTAD